ncbi:GyrI-like domain-containing protein [Histidinibacterium aquaticum]|uniref:GyrI-like domain-containing protein n=1 Tax=Histidinibacterium aquaticum TaxID=2613962 RepID=A0A5J5GRX1_9RHOB|nr:GyrI-like domain-containing protein [Histidinibacterium aquaticum]KAA9010132.1 GyrI-like domain-containing protein [Histidinibacterium aquaticum]
MAFDRITLPPQSYLYVPRESAMTPEAMSEAIGSGFAEVFGFCGTRGITPLSAPICVYFDMTDPIRFHAGVVVAEGDAVKAADPVQAGVLPTEAVAGVHVGPYSSLGQTHQQLWDYARGEGLEVGMPVWEVYLDDPGEVAEEALRTEIFRAVG